VRLSLGPISYYWPRQRVLEFYHRAARCAVDVVYLGEIVCSKRRELGPGDWLSLAAQLRDAGKEVVLSTLTLLESASEASALKRLCLNGSFTVEANDLSAVQLLSEAGRAFVTGPHINIYNQRSLALLAGLGMRRWVLPVELGLEALRDLQASRPAGVETEVFAFGRLPLAWSARCYTARSLNLPKDQCDFRCLDYPDGRLLQTREGQAFLVLNGIQTQSALSHQVLGQVAELRALGVDMLRISPQSEHTFRVVELFEEAVRGGDVSALFEELRRLLPLAACNGYMAGAPGMEHVTADPA
jgi:collagenase-like PrtC family protease